MLDWQTDCYQHAKTRSGVLLAAPYVHPKLQSVAKSPNPTAEKVTLTIPSQLNGGDRSYRGKG
jgi:hypothetical protein